MGRSESHLTEGTAPSERTVSIRGHLTASRVIAEGSSGARLERSRSRRSPEDAATSAQEEEEEEEEERDLTFRAKRRRRGALDISVQSRCVAWLCAVQRPVTCCFMMGHRSFMSVW